VAVVLALVVMPAGVADAAAPPNVVVILADDMGFSDLGCYGGEIATPHLDALAGNGLRFTQFYNGARCCPTRASLLTGLYPHQAGVGHMMEDRGRDGYRGDLNARCRTIAEVLRPAGYRTYMAGKWHVTRFTAPGGPKHNWPRSRGFDRFYGTIHGAGSFYDPSSLVRDDAMISAYADPEYRPEAYYYTDALSDQAVRYVGEHARDHAGRPFFLYLAYTAAHWPMHATPEDIAPYKGKYDAGYGPIRRARYEKAARLGLIDPSQPLGPPAGDWDAVADRAWEAAGMEVYAAMVTRMDAGIGRLVAELGRTGQLDNTLVLFLQDNGACAEDMGRRPAEGHPNIPRPSRPTSPPLAPSAFAAAGSVPAQTRDGFPVRMGDRVRPGPADTYVAYGRGWANVSNTPLREYKHWVHEGGISTPLIAHWPAGIEARGELRREPAHLVDILATCVDLAGATYPADATPPEGRSLAPAFAGKALDRGDALYWEHERHRAVRLARWKLVAKAGGPWELYDIDADRAEANDLAATRPDLVRDLAARWDAWSLRTGVRPYPPREAPKGKARAKAAADR
jgi:arylsulfatase